MVVKHLDEPVAAPPGRPPRGGVAQVMPNNTKTTAVEPETRTTTGNLALAPPIGQPILTGSRAIPNNARSSSGSSTSASTITLPS